MTSWVLRSEVAAWAVKSRANVWSYPASIQNHSFIESLVSVDDLQLPGQREECALLGLGSTADPSRVADKALRGVQRPRRDAVPVRALAVGAVPAPGAGAATPTPSPDASAGGNARARHRGHDHQDREHEGRPKQ